MSDHSRIVHVTFDAILFQDNVKFIQMNIGTTVHQNAYAP